MLRQMTGAKPAYDAGRFRLGRTGCLSLLPGTALVFSSRHEAMSYSEDNGIKRMQVTEAGMPDGWLLECLGSIDHCDGALLDGIAHILFLSCESGGFVLPSHFIRYRDDRFEALQNDDQWHQTGCTPENPNCQCGSLFFPYTPSGGSNDEREQSCGIFQVIAASRTSHDDTQCHSFAVLDLEPPPTERRLDVEMEADGCHNMISYTITPDGFCCGDMEDDEAEEWDVCPLSGLCRVQLPVLTSRNGLNRITLTVTDPRRHWKSDGARGHCDVLWVSSHSVGNRESSSVRTPAESEAGNCVVSKSRSR